MKRSFVLKSVFAKISFFAFLMIVSFASCKGQNNPSNEPEKPKEIQTVHLDEDEFENILADKDKIKDYLMIDVRHVGEGDYKDKLEYQAGHTFCAISIPLDIKKYDAKDDAKDETRFTDTSIFDSKLIEGMQDKKIILQCKGDNRSQKTWRILNHRGYKNLFYVYGASAYESAKIPGKDRNYKKENYSRIPAILESQIPQGAKILDVRSMTDEAIKAEAAKLKKTEIAVVRAGDARTAYDKAKIIEKVLELGAGSSNDDYKRLQICVTPLK